MLIKTREGKKFTLCGEFMSNESDDPILKSWHTNNPYRFAAINVVRRMLWDIRPESWLSRSRLKKLKNKHIGKKAVILCNGPTLLKTDFETLASSNVFTFGLNKINLLFDKNNFRPNCIVAVNPYVIEQNREFFNKTELPLFLSSVGTRKRIRFRPNINYLHSTSVQYFARDCSMSLYEGATVTYVALQLAFHMGFHEVTLVGADHNFETKGPANKLIASGNTDPNHFDPNYFAGGVKWQLPDLFESEVAYGRARQVYEAFGRKLFNSTEGGKLEAFERVTLDRFISS